MTPLQLGLLLAGTAAVAVPLLVRSRSIRVGPRRYASPDELAAEVGLPLARTLAGTLFVRLTNVRLVGPLSSSRRASVRFERREPLLVARLAVAGDRGAHFVLTGPDLAPLGPLARAESPLALALQETVKAAFEHFHVARLEHARGELVATLDATRLDPAHYRALLTLLDTAASVLDRVPILVESLEAQRLALARPGGEGRRCAGCEAPVSGDEPDLVACAACSTVLHDGCFRTAGECLLPGCASRRAERGS